MGKKRGKGKKKAQNVKKGAMTDGEPDELKNAPHSFVFYRGTVGNTIVELTRDFKKLMEPFTASSLKARKANNVKDFLSVAGILHVSHMCIFTATETGTYMKLARVPRGPTMYFKVLNFALSRDVISSLKKQFVYQKQFEYPPLVILNSFNNEIVHHKLMASMFQNMFPAINLTKINLNTIRRCVLFHYNEEKEEIDVRHFAIKIVPVGMSKGVKKIVQSKVPDLSKLEDISEFITKAHILSDSEAEDDPASHVTLPQKLSSRGNMATAQSSIRLIEHGPRMTLQLQKIEDGFLGGEVLFHRHIIKTEDEKAEILKKRMEKRRKKEERKRFQEQMVRRKEKVKEDHKQKSLDGMKKKTKVAEEFAGEQVEDDDDREWYRKEVGEEPDEDLFDKKSTGEKRKAYFRDDSSRRKRRRTDDAGKSVGFKKAPSRKAPIKGGNNKRKKSK